ncbi:unnamed protein product, partial [Iphiclides podalirius]
MSLSQLVHQLQQAVYEIITTKKVSAVSQSKKTQCRRECSEMCLLRGQTSGACLHKSCYCGGQVSSP